MLYELTYKVLIEADNVEQARKSASKLTTFYSSPLLTIPRIKKHGTGSGVRVVSSIKPKDGDESTEVHVSSLLMFGPVRTFASADEAFKEADKAIPKQQGQ